jgi:hypothetical protein
MTSKSKGTPSLAPGQEWKPTSSPGPYREHIGGGTAHPPERSTDERFLRWNDSTKNSWAVAHGAKPAPKAPRGRAKWQ